MNWHALPFVRMLLPFGLGILAAYYGPQLPIRLIIASFFIIGLGLALLFIRRQITFRFRKWFGIGLFFQLLGLGYLLCFFHTPWNHKQHVHHHTDATGYWSISIEQVQKKEKTIRISGRLSHGADSAGHAYPVFGKALFYLPIDSASKALKPGDEIVIHQSLSLLDPPKNPKAFDFAGYMAKKGIYHTAFVGNRDWEKINTKNIHWRQHLFTWQQYCRNILARHLKGDDTFSIGAALILGQREHLGEHLRKAYTHTGAVHILAVSGLHVGLVYLAISWILKLIGSSQRRFRWLRSLVLVASVCLFALFTGASASVLRAATMFSFIIIGEGLHRRQNIYNTLAASAFFLLCFNPYLLFDVGFQLSYLAVTGIVFFQGKIYRSWYISHPPGRYVWKLTSVSLAAQITTLPISLFYFHQFPLYFWLSGWVVVPAAALILSCGIALLVFSKISLLGNLLGSILSWVIEWMNSAIFHIQQLPASLIEGIWLEWGIVCLLYLTLFFFMRGLHFKQVRYIQLSIILCLVVGLHFNVKRWKAEGQRLLSIYHLPGHTAIDIFFGSKAVCFSDLPPVEEKLVYTVSNFRAAHTIRQFDYRSLNRTDGTSPTNRRLGHFFQIEDYRLAIISQLPTSLPQSPIPLDYLIIRDNPKLEIQDLLPFFEWKMLVFDTSNRRKRISKWKEECKKMLWKYYDVNAKGAFVKSF